MMMKKRKAVSVLALTVTIISGCMPRKDFKKTSEEVSESAPTEISPEQTLEAPVSPDFSDVGALYSSLGPIPAEYKTEGAMRDGRYWSYLSGQKQAELQAYLAANKAGLDAFIKNPVAANGAPALIFRLLPDVMPHIFSNAKFEAATGYYRVNPSDPLPYGFAFTKAPSAAGGPPSPLLVQVSCAACHTGRVVGPRGNIQTIVGAPSTVADINGYKSTLTQAVRDPAYTLEKFAAALASKKDGELYGPDRILEEKTDRAIFQAAGAGLLQAFKDGLIQRAEYTAKTAGAYSLKGDLRTLARSPGHIDFPIAVALATAPPAEVLADPINNLKKYFPPMAGVADIMSIWQQEKRNFAQWDGNLKNKLTRNLGAEVGVAGDPKVVNFPNALITTEFVEKLPAPSYPFKVDMIKATEGKKIYDKACASCHENEYFMPVAKAGTEPGRAIGLTKDTRLLLTAALRMACSDKTLSDCLVPDNEMVVPREENPGYISLPLTGIWARAPYLHNGSVPTLWHLLSGERPEEFQLNDLGFDQKFVGFNWEIKAQESSKGQNDKPSQNSSSVSSTGNFVVRYDTKIPGFGNKGHSDKDVFNGGIDFRSEPAKLDALLEYLKTL